VLALALVALVAVGRWGSRGERWERNWFVDLPWELVPTRFAGRERPTASLAPGSAHDLIDFHLECDFVPQPVHGSDRKRDHDPSVYWRRIAVVEWAHGEECSSAMQ